MSGTPEGARKRIEKLKELHGPDYFKVQTSHAGKHTKRGGFASEKVGKDGLTGRQRAKIAGRKGGQNTPGNFKNDPERASRVAKGRYVQEVADDIEETTGK